MMYTFGLRLAIVDEAGYAIAAAFRFEGLGKFALMMPGPGHFSCTLHVPVTRNAGVFLWQISSRPIIQSDGSSPGLNRFLSR